MNKKKGALSLSINTIVVLILAVVMIGLGIALTRNIFTVAETKVKIAVATHDVTNPPTVDNPITLTPPSIELRPGESGDTNIAFISTETEVRDYRLEITDVSGNPCNIIPYERCTFDEDPGAVGITCGYEPCTTATTSKAGDVGVTCGKLLDTKPFECPTTLIYGLDKFTMKPGQINVWRVAIKPKTTEKPGTIQLYTAKMLCVNCAYKTEYQRNVEVQVKI